MNAAELLQVSEDSRAAGRTLYRARAAAVRVLLAAYPGCSADWAISEIVAFERHSHFRADL